MYITFANYTTMQFKDVKTIVGQLYKRWRQHKILKPEIFCYTNSLQWELCDKLPWVMSLVVWVEDDVFENEENFEEVEL